MARLSLGARVALVTVVLGAGCTLQETGIKAPNDSPFVDGGTDTTALSGYAWDPELSFIYLRTCEGSPDECSPALVPHSGVLSVALLKNATVRVLDGATGLEQDTAPTPTDDKGLFFIPKVVSRASPVYLSSTGGAPAPSEVSLPFPLATATYQRTVNLRPILMDYSLCANLQAVRASDTGVLQAVAKYLTLHGKPTAVADFINPAKYRGVAVWWLLVPQVSFFDVPVDSSTVHASRGVTLNLGWKAPGQGPAGLQSERGFYVVDSPFSDLGLSVTLLPTPTTTTSTVTFTPEDAVSNADEGRPYHVEPFSVTLPSGMVAYTPLLFGPPANGSAETGEESEWYCTGASRPAP